ncbi:MAG: 23S rRNA (guanosine(2251)-2'-O)-methyltransferase RlmB [Candidatus Omnitrophota bacterium]|nr:23S rRNA (guanosine(2251)-2'-O)-methyltransferase RlmB [Candidatus Omnitrophota bacterium]
MARNFMLLYGRNSVFERLKTNSKTIRKILLQDNFNVPRIEKLIKTNNIPVERLSSSQLANLKHAKDLQGIAARVDRFEYIPFDDLLNKPKNEQLALIFLDRINDPHNLGVIIRTAACFGGFGVVIPKFEACEVNETVLHVASGGENYTPVSIVTNLSNAVIKVGKSGYWIVGAVVSEKAEDIGKVSLPFPLGLVLGSEGGGIRYGLEKHLDIKAHIPMQGARLSFNVNMACAIFCHEICKQRGIINEKQDKERTC